MLYWALKLMHVLFNPKINSQINPDFFFKYTPKMSTTCHITQQASYFLQSVSWRRDYLFAQPMAEGVQETFFKTVIIFAVDTQLGFDAFFLFHTNEIQSSWAFSSLSECYINDHSMCILRFYLFLWWAWNPFFSSYHSTTREAVITDRMRAFQ